MNKINNFLILTLICYISNSNASQEIIKEESSGGSKGPWISYNQGNIECTKFTNTGEARCSCLEINSSGFRFFLSRDLCTPNHMGSYNKLAQAYLAQEAKKKEAVSKSIEEKKS